MQLPVPLRFLKTYRHLKRHDLLSKGLILLTRCVAYGVLMLVYSERHDGLKRPHTNHYEQSWESLQLSTVKPSLLIDEMDLING